MDSSLMDKGQGIHAEVRMRGLITNNPVIGNAVVDMYAKCDMLLKAQQVFDELPTPNIVSWNAMISGYVQNGFKNENHSWVKKRKQTFLVVNCVMSSKSKK